jgi:Tfp pilus assembly protein PilE
MTRGFTLLIAVILASVALAVGIALLDISYKQYILASSARQSQTAFYNADTALECALYYDQQQNSFAYAGAASSITCNGASIAVSSSDISGTQKQRTFTIQTPCSGGQSSGSVTVYKWSNGSTTIFASGFNTCDPNNLRRIERGLKVVY